MHSGQETFVELAAVAERWDAGDVAGVLTDSSAGTRGVPGEQEGHPSRRGWAWTSRAHVNSACVETMGGRRRNSSSDLSGEDSDFLEVLEDYLQHTDPLPSHAAAHRQESGSHDSDEGESGEGEDEDSEQGTPAWIRSAALAALVDPRDAEQGWAAGVSTGDEGASTGESEESELEPEPVVRTAEEMEGLSLVQRFPVAVAGGSGGGGPGGLVFDARPQARKVGKKKGKGAGRIDSDRPGQCTPGLGSLFRGPAPFPSFGGWQPCAGESLVGY